MTKCNIFGTIAASVLKLTVFPYYAICFNIIPNTKAIFSGVIYVCGK